MNCKICKIENPLFSWTDTHGIAQCNKCGAPYKIYHYEGEGNNKKRVDKPPKLCIKAEYVRALQAYVKKSGRIIPSGYSFPGGQELASDDDIEAFARWMKQYHETTSK